jgi:hypothetical protein
VLEHGGGECIDEMDTRSLWAECPFAR